MRVPHPGFACCDPTRDLAGWIAGQRARVADLWEQSRTHREQGDRLDRQALQALTAGDHQGHAALDAQARHAYGLANAAAQAALIAEGDVDRIAAAHTHRLQPDTPTSGQLNLFQETP